MGAEYKGFVVVTGANGFAGRAVCEHLVAQGARVRRVVRAASAADEVGVGDLTAYTEWAELVSGADAVVHLAARTHRVHETGAGDLEAYRPANVDVTERLARAAAECGVPRFLLASSVKVNGDGGPVAYTERDTPQPRDAYGRSKWEAEQRLHEIAARTGLEVVILRPPLVYGPGVKANFLRLMQLVARGVPLPLGAVQNRRSLLYVGNLADAIVTAIATPAAKGRTYLVSDGVAVSTPQLIRALAAALGVPPRLINVPPALLRAGAALLGQRDKVDRVLGSLELDCSRIGNELGWRPPHSMDEGLARTTAWFRQQSA